MRGLMLICVSLVWLPGYSNTVIGQQTDVSKESLWEAAQNGDLDTVKKCVEGKIDVNAKTRYGATALFYACDRGHKEIVSYLLSNGADVNVKDSFYNATPVTWAMSKGHDDIVLSLAGSPNADSDTILRSAIQSRKIDLIKSLVESGKLSSEGIIEGKKLARTMRAIRIMRALGDNDPLEAATDSKVKVSAEILKLHSGTYVGPRDLEISFTVKDNDFIADINGREVKLTPKSDNEFSFNTVAIVFDRQEDKTTGLTWKAGGTELAFKRVEKKEDETGKKDDNAPKFKPSSEESRIADRAVSSVNWPSFRGIGARGIADGQHPPITWDAENNPESLKWKTEIPGLAHSCPAIWKDKIFVTSAISQGDDKDLKIGLYGDVDSVDDDSVHKFVIYCLNKQTGEVLWKQVANEAVPKVKRHLKSTHANSTPATNGTYVIAFFGSEGLYCYKVDGTLVWQKDFGKLDSGWFYDAGYQWGFGSSPIIFENKVVVQCDIQKESFLACFDLATGDEIWRQQRDEIPSWSSPTIVPSEQGPIVVTNATNFVRANLLSDGQELWRLGTNSEIVVPTPIFAHNRVFVSSGYRPVQPIYSIDPNAEGDITLKDGELKNKFIDWSKKRGGPYMPCPIIYGDYLYTCQNSGVLACIDAKTGEQVYRRRMRAPGGALSFVGSPVASDGHLYFPAEDGRVLVVKAGPEFELVSVNRVAEYILSTPAISDGMMFIRGQNHVFAFGTADKQN